MKKKLTFAVCCLCMIFYSNCKQALKENIETKITQEDYLKRGEYLVTISDCNECHTPKKMTEQGPIFDLDKMLSGFPSETELPKIIQTNDWVLFSQDLTAAVGPWGVTFSANITPHETGIGNWTFEQFKKAITQGKHKGLDNGRPLLPPMPWRSYSAMTDDDLKSIFEYLNSIPPIENLVPNPLPPINL